MVHDYLFGLGVVLLVAFLFSSFVIYCILQMAKEPEAPPIIQFEEELVREQLPSLASFQKRLWVLKLRAVNCCLRWQTAIDEQRVRESVDSRLVAFMKKFDRYDLDRDDLTVQRIQILVQGELDIILRFMRTIRTPDYGGPPYPNVFCDRILEGIPHATWLPEENYSVPFLETLRKIAKLVELAEWEIRLAEVYIEGIEGEIRTQQR